MPADPFFVRLSSSRLSMRMSQVIGLPNSAKTESGIRIRCRSINRVSLKISSMRNEEQWLRFGESSINGWLTIQTDKPGDCGLPLSPPVMVNHRDEETSAATQLKEALR